MVVESDPDTAERYGTWLRDEGHRVSLMSDASRALIFSPILRPSVAVLDIALPGLDGLALASLLRGMPQLAQCRFIAVTACSNAQLQSRCDEAGIIAVLKKPVARQALVESVVAAAWPSALPQYH